MCADVSKKFDSFERVSKIINWYCLLFIVYCFIVYYLLLLLLFIFFIIVIVFRVYI